MKSACWKDLQRNYTQNSCRSIASLFKDNYRFKNFSVAACDILVDYSKTNIDYEAKNLLLRLVAESGLEKKRQALFSGESLNTSENMPSLHFALRSKHNKLLGDRKHFIADIDRTLTKMRRFVIGIRSGETKSCSGEKFTDVLNIGIGGSDLGSRMATLSLIPYHDGPRCHFVSNLDGTEIFDTLKTLNPERTLIVISSKSFSTLETMVNAKAAISWLQGSVKNGLEKHLVAITCMPEKPKTYGISDDRVFSFSNYIGGRYSIWGPVGLPLMLAIGPKWFEEFLKGAELMDKHFLEKDLERNLPVVMASVGIWHRNICNYTTRAILPYENRLAKLPSYLQQLDMESNGKSCSTENDSLSVDTVPVVWGEVGTNGQHAFYQALHQGTSIIPCEFLIAAKNHESNLSDRHELLIANCLAQSEALMQGHFSSQKFKDLPGNRPSTTIVYSKLTPKVLGSLLALFEHRTFVEGIVWGINSFDQWGIEFGKKISEELVPLIRKKTTKKLKNASTAGLLSKILQIGTES